MATAGQLVGVMARALNLPIATVSSYYRVLREAGLVTKGGRGRSAPQVSARDVARLLITLMSADALSEGAAACELIGETQATVMLSDVLGDGRGQDVDTISFEEAVIALLNGKAADQSVEMHRLPVSLFWVQPASFSVRVSATSLSAEIVSDDIVLPFSLITDAIVTDPEDWESLTTRERLIARSVIARMDVTRTITQSEFRDVSLALVLD